MIRRTLLILSAAAVSGCFDFDAAYTQFCDGGRCADAGTGTGGGTATGGGAATGGAGGGAVGGGGGSGGGAVGGGVGGGGAVGGGGGAVGGGGGAVGGGGGAVGGGGGTTGGGGGVTGGGGGTVDAGCPEFLCPQINWMSARSSVFYTVAPGLMTESLNRFHIFASFEANATGSNNFTHFEYRFVDGGVSAPLQRFLDNRVETRQLRGNSMTDYTVTYRTSAERYEGSITPENFYACTALDGGMTDPWHYAVAPVSADEMYLVGYPFSICHWTRAGGLVATNDPDLRPTVYLNDVYRTPAGDVYVVGADYTTNTGTGVIFTGDGTPVSASPVPVDTYYTDGFNGVGGTGSEVFALSRSNSAQRGEIQQLQADGGFQRIYQAPFRLAQFSVMPTGEIWAVGQAPDRVVYFDGGAWADHLLPLTEFRSNVRWENINATDEGIILTGFETQDDGGNTAVVNTYRRFGK